MVSCLNLTFQQLNILQKLVKNLQPKTDKPLNRCYYMFNILLFLKELRIFFFLLCLTHKACRCRGPSADLTNTTFSYKNIPIVYVRNYKDVHLKNSQKNRKKKRKQKTNKCNPWKNNKNSNLIIG